MTGILLEDNSVNYKGANMTVVCHHTNDSESVYHNVTKVDCDGVVVAVHYYDTKREIKTAFFDLGYDTEHSECMISSYEVNV